jgi:hypothetical protein
MIDHKDGFDKATTQVSTVQIQFSSKKQTAGRILLVVTYHPDLSDKNNIIKKH